MPTTTLLKRLLDAGVHFGHQTERWNPKMKRFIFGRRAGIYIIDLQQTEQGMQRACDFVEGLAAKGELVLFVGTKKQAKVIIREQALRCGMPSVSTRWLGGTLTNFNTLKRNIQLLTTLRQQREEGYFERLTKKDAKHHERQLERLEGQYAGLVTMTRLPACVYVVDPKREQNAVHEANRLNLPIIAICDTNANPDQIAYPIPGNDDALRSVRLITTMLTDRIIAGRRGAGLPIVPMEHESDDAPESETPPTADVAEVNADNENPA